jgi:hypothetical protein
VPPPQARSALAPSKSRCSPRDWEGREAGASPPARSALAPSKSRCSPRDWEGREAGASPQARSALAPSKSRARRSASARSGGGNLAPTAARSCVARHAARCASKRGDHQAVRIQTGQATTQRARVGRVRPRTDSTGPPSRANSIGAHRPARDGRGGRQGFDRARGHARIRSGLTVPRARGARRAPADSTGARGRGFERAWPLPKVVSVARRPPDGCLTLSGRDAHAKPPESLPFVFGTLIATGGAGACSAPV